jgi:hypothetical protein
MSGLPCQRDPDMWFGYEADGTRRRPRTRKKAQQLCVTECPLAAFQACALEALRMLEHPTAFAGASAGHDDGNLDLDGVWAGVDLRGAVVHKKPGAMEEARRQLAAAAHQSRGAA